MNLWILLKRRQFLLDLAVSGQDMDELKAKYNLNEDDILEIE